MISFNSILTYSVEINKFQPVEILKRKCLTCHNDNGSAPFSLETASSIKAHLKMMNYVISNNYMPYWLPDTLFSRFKNERVLTTTEKKTLISWLKNDKLDDIRSEISKSKTIIKKPDLIIKPKLRFITTGNNFESFGMLRIPYSINKTTTISSLLVKPSDMKLTHHARIQIMSVPDNMPDSVFNELSLVLNLSYDDFATSNFSVDPYTFKGYPLTFVYQDGWAPGYTKRVFSNNTGFILPKRGCVLIDLHYGASINKITDSIQLGFYFDKDNEVKKILKPYNVGPIRFPPMIIPANTIDTFTTEMVLEKDMDIYSISPHMHLLGAAFKAIALTPDDKIIPIIKINSWDFSKQEFYDFKDPLYLPKGTKIIVTGVFNNTSSNFKNPNSPPKTINSYSSMLTTDEMLMLLFLAVDR